eukprot:7445176-Lingulodinium_polyedra.AAC.1
MLSHSSGEDKVEESLHPGGLGWLLSCGVGVLPPSPLQDRPASQVHVVLHCHAVALSPVAELVGNPDAVGLHFMPNVAVLHRHKQLRRCNVQTG